MQECKGEVMEKFSRRSGAVRFSLPCGKGAEIPGPMPDAGGRTAQRDRESSNEQERVNAEKKDGNSGIENSVKRLNSLSVASVVRQGSRPSAAGRPNSRT